MNYQNLVSCSLSYTEKRLISQDGKDIHEKSLETKGVPEVVVRNCSSIYVFL